ncbi:MAG: alanine racemase [Deltaproteobacteria bacterium]|nr:MAG: alanine racemase [Deltaproteobacteria bacterium]
MSLIRPKRPRFNDISASGSTPMIDLSIDLAALRHNYRQIRQCCGPGVKMLAVVKADAYGHGLVPVSRALVAEAVDYLGVAYLGEGLALRQAGITTPILMLMGILPQDAASVVAHDLEVVVFRADVVEALVAQARQQGKRILVHLKVDTGMGRLGLPPEEVMDFLNWLRGFPELSVMGLISHFAVADQADKFYTLQQLARFTALLQEARHAGWSVPLSHISNSAACLELDAAHLGMVRPGIMLYGSPPAPDRPPPVTLKPVMAMQTQILQLKRLPPGCSISYGCTFTTSAECLVAVLPVGYCNGYSRHLSNCGEVLIRGQRAPIRGRVCMNLTMVEVTHIAAAQEGDLVTLLGADQGDRITADDLAAWTGTISYEFYCLLGNSNPRRFLGE